MKHSDINIIYIVCLFAFLFPSGLIADTYLYQDTIRTTEKNDILLSNDTTTVAELPKEYQALKEQSSKNKWTRRLFSLLFHEAPPPEDMEDKRNIADEFKPYEGKIIRNIHVLVLSPFGTDINHPENDGSDLNFLNNLHASTRESTIKSLIQFRENKPLRASIAASSEAELRNAGYIYDARISVMPLQQTSDSIDINVVVRDKWTIGLNLHGLSSRKVDVEVFDRNILGTGSRIGLDFIYSSRYDRKFGIGASYTYENVARKNINLIGNYVDRIKEYELYFGAVRELQPKLDYFGEISYRKKVLQPHRIDWDSITPDINEEFSITAGRAFTLSDHNAIRRVVLSLRYKMKSPRYKEPIYQDHISDRLVPYKYTKNQMLLMQLSLFQNSYFREYMVYNFGNTEDIAQGYNISTQLGYSRFSDMNNAFYTSLSASYGSNEIVNGNIYLNSAISSFFAKKKPFGGVFKVNARYFTPLFKFSGLRFRQFLSFDYSKLLHPDRYLGDRIYMGEHTTLKMRDWQDDKKGTEFLLFKSETDIFSNYEIAGFRFLFYSFFDMGWIKQNRKLFQNDNFNYGIGIGLRLRNNFIVFNTIDLKIGFYPKLDQGGFNSFFKVTSSTPDMYPNFTPGIPEEIVLE